jgi:hypothetical protein
LAELCYNLSLLRDAKQKIDKKPIRKNYNSNKNPNKESQRHQQRKPLDKNKR